MSQVIENLMLTGMLHIPEYQMKVVPVVKPEYFENETCMETYKLIKSYVNEYRSSPSKDALELLLEESKGMSENTYQSIKNILPKMFDENLIKSVQKQNVEFLLRKTEKHITTRAAFLAILEGYQICSGADTKRKLECLPELLKEAISISFNTNLGHDYLLDAEKRFDFYHETLQRIPFALAMMNYITNGGLARKTLNLIIAGTGIGKTLYMTDYASFLLKQGYNVAYFTFEMQDMRIAQRMDAKLMGITLEELDKLTKEQYLKRIDDIKNSTTGSLKVLEYPNGSFTTIHMKNVLNDLKNKSGFIPDIIFVDYLTLMASYRLGIGAGTYSYAKAIAEELRALAMSENVAIFSANQTNRSGQNATDVELSEVSDSHGISMTADFIAALISTADLAQLNHVRVKQLKNRYGDVFKPNSFLIGVEKAKMTFYDVDLPNTHKMDYNIDNVDDSDMSPSVKKTNHDLVF